MRGVKVTSEAAQMVCTPSSQHVLARAGHNERERVARTTCGCGQCGSRGACICFLPVLLFTHRWYQSVLEGLVATWASTSKKAERSKAEAKRRELVKQMVEAKDDHGMKLGVCS